MNIENDKKFNRKLFPFYKMMAWDLLFYYAISYLFMTQVKGLTASQIIFADAFYPLFKFILQIPSTIIIEKIGKRKSLIFANSLIAIYLVMVLGLINTNTLIIANFFAAFGYVIKGIAEPTLLFDSLDNEHKRENFSNIEGKGNAWYYYIDALTAITTGFLFVFNPYLPMTVSFAITVITIFMSYKFKEIPVSEDNKEIEEELEVAQNYSKLPVFQQIKIYLKDLSQAFKFVSKSGRLKSLIFFNSIFASLLSVMITLTRSLLDYLNIPAKYFGVIFALLGLVAGFSSNRSFKIHTKYKNKALTVLSISFTLAVLLSGFVVFLHLPPFLAYFFVLTMLTVQYWARGPFYALIKQYLNSFCDSSMRVKIYSANSLVECIIRSSISFACSYLVDITTIDIAHIILGGISTLVILHVLNYMKTRVGLKPDEYKKSDISFNEVV